eukprot:10397-Heterococcus_DN1.PRE.2
MSTQCSNLTRDADCQHSAHTIGELTERVHAQPLSVHMLHSSNLDQLTALGRATPPCHIVFWTYPVLAGGMQYWNTSAELNWRCQDTARGASLQQQLYACAESHALHSQAVQAAAVAAASKLGTVRYSLLQSSSHSTSALHAPRVHWYSSQAQQSDSDSTSYKHLRQYRALATWIKLVHQPHL